MNQDDRSTTENSETIGQNAPRNLIAVKPKPKVVRDTCMESE